MSKICSTGSPGLLVRLLFLLPGLLPAAGLLTTLAALLLFLLMLIGHEITPWSEKTNNAALRADLPVALAVAWLNLKRALRNTQYPLTTGFQFCSERV
jgi:hypothetical protein